MESSSNRGTRPELARTDSTGEPTRGGSGDKDKMHVDSRGTTLAPPAQRTVRYKEKFQGLRDKYEQVMSTHDRYEKELALANKKLKDLQNECNLLLDAVDIAVPGQPTLQHYLQYDPVPSYMASAPSTYMIPPAAPGPPAAPPPAPTSSVRSPQPPTPARSHSRSAAPQTNGVNGH